MITLSIVYENICVGQALLMRVSLLLFYFSKMPRMGRMVCKIYQILEKNTGVYQLFCSIKQILKHAIRFLYAYNQVLRF
jgi:hypothetical protein